MVDRRCGGGCTALAATSGCAAAACVSRGPRAALRAGMWKTSASAAVDALSDAVEALADAVHAAPSPIGVRRGSVSGRRETATTGCDVVDGSCGHARKTNSDRRRRVRRHAHRVIVGNGRSFCHSGSFSSAERLLIDDSHRSGRRDTHTRCR